MVLIRPAMIASALLSVGSYRLKRRVSRSTVHCSALRSNPAGWRSTLQSRWMFWRIKLRRNVAMAPARARATMTTTRTCARTASARASRQNGDLVRKISDPIPLTVYPSPRVGPPVRPLGVVLLEHWRQWLVAELAADDLEVRRVGGRGPERGELAGVGGENIAPARSQSIKRLLGFGKRDLLKPEVAQAHLICDVSFARCSGEDANTRAVEII